MPFCPSSTRQTVAYSESNSWDPSCGESFWIHHITCDVLLQFSPELEIFVHENLTNVLSIIHRRSVRRYYVWKSWLGPSLGGMNFNFYCPIEHVI